MVRPNTEQKLDMAAGGSTRAGRGIGAEAPRKVQPFEGKHFFGGGVPHSPTLERAKDLHCSVIIWALGRLFGLFRKALDELVKSDEAPGKWRSRTRAAEEIDRDTRSVVRLPTTIKSIGFTEPTKDFTLQKPAQPFF